SERQADEGLAVVMKARDGAAPVRLSEALLVAREPQQPAVGALRRQVGHGHVLFVAQALRATGSAELVIRSLGRAGLTGAAADRDHAVLQRRDEVAVAVVALLVSRAHPLGLGALLL